MDIAWRVNWGLSSTMWGIGRKYENDNRMFCECVEGKSVETSSELFFWEFFY